MRFRLPTGAGGAAANMASGLIRRELTQWAEQYKITNYQVILKQYNLYVTFTDESHYTVFMLTWEPSSYSTGWPRISVDSRII